MTHPHRSEVSIPVEGASVPGELLVPADAAMVVLFAHGSGSSRRSPRNQLVASYLVQQGLGTLLFDLLTPAEDRDYARRYLSSMVNSEYAIFTRTITPYVKADSA